MCVFRTVYSWNADSEARFRDFSIPYARPTTRSPGLKRVVEDPMEWTTPETSKPRIVGEGSQV